MDQPGKVVNPVRGGQLNRENVSSLSPFAPENLVSQNRFGRPVPHQPAHSSHSGWIWCLLTGFVPLSAAGSIYLFIPPYIRLRASPESIKSRNCVPMASLRRYFQHANFIPIVGVGKRGAYQLVCDNLRRQHPFGTTLKFTGPVPVDSR